MDNKELKSVINKRKLTYCNGNPVEKKGVSRKVCNEISKAKQKFKEKCKLSIAVVTFEQPGKVSKIWPPLTKTLRPKHRLV